MKIRNVIDTLNQQISYCHFKSNQHLDESFDGKTDFDLLIHKKDIYKFQKIVSDFGFKRRFSSANKQYYGMEDYIGFDSLNGKLYHFHVHYQLIFGKKLRKNFVIELNDEIWDNLQLDDAYNIYIPSPEIELILLIIRVSLKTQNSFKNFIKVIINKEIIPRNILNEFDYLLQRIDESKLNESCENLNVDADLVFKIFLLLKNSKLNSFSFFVYKKKLIESISNFKILNEEKSIVQENVRTMSVTNSGSWFSTVGTGIGFVGCDGSGKSTIVDEILKWLSWKVSVNSIYMGRPKNFPLSIRILEKVNSYLIRFRLTNFTETIKNKTSLYIARVRKQNFDNSLSFKRSGNVVIFDRFPMKEFWSMEEPMDGPRILNNSIARQREENLYKTIKEPELLFLLNVEIEESLKRKKSQGIIEDRVIITRKYNAIQHAIKEAKSRDNIFVVDAMQPYEDVVLKIKKIIWEKI